MTIDYLIIGQGISGTLFSWFLELDRKSFYIIDEAIPSIPSRVAAGVMNPVTGRRYVTSWMIDEILPFAIDAYEEMEKALGQKLVYRKNIIDFFANPQVRDVFVERISEGNSYLQSYPDQNHFNQFFDYHFGCGEISPCYTVDLNALLSAWRKKMLEEGKLAEERFEEAQLELKDDHIQYGNITASKIIFCNGLKAAGLSHFHMLPFTPNKGEALIIECPGMNNQFMFKRSHTLVPLPQKDLFWFGSNYSWEMEDPSPTEKFLRQATTLLDNWLKLPYKVVDHKTALRPATIERRPFVGLHPHQPLIGILNGMGSKGTSLAPFFARQLKDHLLHQKPITPQAHVERFARILAK